MKIQEIWQIFLGMFLLFLGLVSLGMGGFTTYFGAGKSRVIGLILLALGAVFLAILYVLVADEDLSLHIDGCVTTGAFLSVLAAAVGLGVAVGIVIIPMMLGSKETIDEIESLTQKAMEEEDKAASVAGEKAEERASSFAPPEEAEKVEEPAEDKKEDAEGPVEEQPAEPETPEPEEEKQEESEEEEKPEAETPEPSEEQPVESVPPQSSEDDEDDDEDIDPELCIYCGSTEDIQLAHIIAPSKGGKMPVPACPTCNSSKGDKALMEWLRWVKENRPERWEEIITHNKGKRSVVARKIHTIRDEPTKTEEVE